MARVILKDVMKVYPHNESKKKRNKKAKAGDMPEKKSHLKVTEEGVVAVQEFSIDIADKEFVVLVGPSGCGKSTTLRMIAGLEDISSGELYIGDKLVNGIEPKDRNIAMVFQSYALYPHLSVYDNLAFPLKLSKMPKDQIDEKVREAAKILDITQYLDRKPKALSGGQRQRVAIGRAIVRHPSVLLMDEPLSNLDAKLRNQMRAEIIKLRSKIDTTFIYVTHDQTEAMTLGDRIVIMKDGEIMQIGTPQHVFDWPNNIFVAGFIGTPQMNFFDGYLVKNATGYDVAIPYEDKTAIVKLNASAQAKLKEQGIEDRKNVTIGIRPEHIKFAKGADANTISGFVEVSEMMGSEIYLHANAAGKDIILRVPTTELPPESRSGVPYGTQVTFTFPADLIHIFDPETEQNMLI